MKHTIFLLPLLFLFACGESETSQSDLSSDADSAVVALNDSESLARMQGFLEYQFSDRYEARGNFEEELADLDLSPIWTTETFPGDLPLNHLERAEPLGYIGQDKQRLYMHLSNVRQDEVNSLRYLVTGKSMVKGNICDFAGELIVTGVQEFTLPYHGKADYLVDPHEARFGVLTGTYHFFEDSTQRHVGEFEGTIISSFMLRKAGQPEYGLMGFISDGYLNHQFTGTWSGYGSDRGRPANWGDYRTPEAGDLDIGAGEFMPSPKYAEKGWDGQVVGDWWE